ncbi:PASTA domain-containing protein [Streptomyces sp. NBC_00258]|uniref:PASTA domain-containing protein n=1 Tax=Streptomyces sp. NBC_00258 TaxID=2903642 RepID=UPI002E2D8E6B|nr:PASTA domain-containing protein [Streptomyces sp. NBC_00258]
MRTRTITTLAAIVMLALTGCAAEDTGTSTDSDPAPKAPATSQTSDTKKDSDTATEDAPAAEKKPETASLPNVVGKDLQAAQDEAQAAGFYALDDQDASGQNRLQVLDRNWTVCKQEPAAGTHPTDTPVVLYAVKDTETC